MKATFTALAAALLLAPAIQAETLLYSWENDDAQGWSNFDGFTDVGATHGSNAIHVTVGSGWSASHRTPDIWNDAGAAEATNLHEHLNANTTILVDITPHEDMTGSFQWALRVRGTAGETTIYQSINVDGGETQTVAYDYSDLLAEHDGNVGSRADLLFIGNTPGDSTFDGNTFSFDNLRVIPEPASAGLLAIGATALLLRRRRQE